MCNFRIDLTFFISTFLSFLRRKLTYQKIINYKDKYSDDHETILIFLTSLVNYKIIHQYPFF